MIQGLVKLFLFQALGEVVSKFLLPFIPGPVIGLVLLLGFLVVRQQIPADIDLVGSSILAHLGLLFVPASVGVVLFLPQLRAHAAGLAATLTLSVIATIGMTSLFLKAVGPNPSGDQDVR